MLKRIKGNIPVYVALVIAAFMLIVCIQGLYNDVRDMHTVEAADSNTYTITVYTGDGTILGTFGNVTGYTDYKYYDAAWTNRSSTYAPSNYIAFYSGGKYYQYYNCCVEIVLNSN